MFVVFHGRIKTSQVFICDASVVGPMPILLFAGTIDSKHAVDAVGEEEEEEEEEEEGNEETDASVYGSDCAAQSSADGNGSSLDSAGSLKSAGVTLEIDGWLRFATSARQARLFTGLRRCIGALLQSKLSPTHEQLDGATEDKIVRAVAGIIRESDCGAGAEKAQPLPQGWESVEDPSSSTGRVFFRNSLSGKTQRERPTRPATEARKEPPGARGPPPVLTPAPPVPKEQSEAEKQAAVEKTARLATARAEEKARQAEAAEKEAAQARLASIRLAAEAEQRERQGKETNGVRVLSVGALLKKLDLEHYAERFAAAGIDDDSLRECIGIINEEDEEDGASEVRHSVCLSVCLSVRLSVCLCVTYL